MLFGLSAQFLSSNVDSTLKSDTMDSQAASTTNDVTTYMKKPLELEEKNPNGLSRTIYWRERPIHAFAKIPLIRKFATDTTLTHWGVQLGDDYIWELEVQDGKVGYHVGLWTVPEKEGVPFVGTKHDGDPEIVGSSRGEAVGMTCMTDFEIQAEGNVTNQKHSEAFGSLIIDLVDRVVKDMNDGEGKSFIDGVLQFYSLTHPLRNFQRLHKPWRDAHRYDEAINNCQDFAQRLVTRIKTGDATTQNQSTEQPTVKDEKDMTKKATAKKKGRLLRIAFNSSQNIR